jgi:hypothetical protein
MKFPDPGLVVFLGHEVRFNFNDSRTAYRVGPEAKGNGLTSLSFRSPHGARIRLGLSGAGNGLGSANRRRPDL